MREFHLHLFAGDRPDGRVEVELDPFGRAKLAGPNESEREQFERRPRFRRAVIGAIARNSAPKAFGSTIAARCCTVGIVKAPFKAPVGSALARPVATA